MYLNCSAANPGMAATDSSMARRIQKRIGHLSTTPLLHPFWKDSIFRLRADSGDIWCYYPSCASNYFVWVADEFEGDVFGVPATIKVFRYGPSTTFYYEERHLTTEFGLIWYWAEPANVAYLSGCVIEGDTFGIITSVAAQRGAGAVPSVDLVSCYPNPFNTSILVLQQSDFSIP
jgi:hypothetical protein